MVFSSSRAGGGSRLANSSAWEVARSTLVDDNKIEAGIYISFVSSPVDSAEKQHVSRLVSNLVPSEARKPSCPRRHSLYSTLASPMPQRRRQIRSEASTPKAVEFRSASNKNRPH
jgi:hypothetical protein